MRVPRAVQENVAKVREAQAKLRPSSAVAATPAELSEATHLDHEAVLESLEAADAFQAASLDAPARAAETDDAAALLASVPVHDQRFELVEYASVVRGTMAALPERDREAIRLRFGEDLTQDEIAKRLGISQMQVSRLLRRALERLRTVAEASDPLIRPRRRPRRPRRPRSLGDHPEAVQAAPQQAGHLHLGHAHVLRDLGLGEVLLEAQAQDLLLALGQARIVGATASR